MIAGNPGIMPSRTAGVKGPRQLLYRFSSRLCLLLAFLSPGFLPVSSCADPESVAEKISEVLPIKSRSGKVTVVGRDRRECQDIARWADSVLEKLESTLRSEMIFRSRRFIISIREPENGPGVASGLQQSSLGLIQRLVIFDYTNVNIQNVQDAYCRAVLRGTALELMRRSEEKSDPQLPEIPRWLWVGTSQNLDRNLRSRNSDIVLEAWEKGKIPSLASTLKKHKNTASNYKEGGDLDKALSGMIVSWLMSLQGEKQSVITDILKACAEKKEISAEWIKSYSDDFGEISDVEDSWDRWLLGQKNVVYAPGRLSRRVVSQLKSELLIYPGVFGIPLDVGTKGPLTFRHLIGLRSEKWVRNLSATKEARLKLLGVGRGDEFDKTIDLYCEFLKALREGKSAKELDERLSEAERMLSEIDSMTSREIKENREELSDENKENNGRQR